MEPSFFTVEIDKEIKFKKADLETLKDSIEYDRIKSHDYRVCSISNVQYFLALYPNGDNDDCRGQTWLFLHIKLGNAIKVQTDVDISIDSVGFSTKNKEEYLDSNGWGNQICTTKQLFHPKKKFFNIDEMVIKVKGTLKIYLPPNKIAYPISAQWTVNKKDVERKKHLETGDFQFSPDPELKYCILLWPNEIGDNDNEAWILLNLEFGTTVTKIEAVYNISINSANFSHDTEYVFEKSFGFGTCFCLTKNLLDADEKIFVDDKLIINVTGTLFMDREEPEMPIFGISRRYCRKDVQTKSKKDFTIMVGEYNIKVHKQLLLDASPYFIGLFNSGMKESIEMKTIITDFDYEIVKSGIQILYDPKIPTNFTFDQMLELLRFSDKYDIGTIKDLIENHFIENISPTNVCPIINFTSTTVSAPEFHAKCVQFIINCSKESKTVHGLETLDKELMAEIFMQTFTKKFST